MNNRIEEKLSALRRAVCERSLYAFARRYLKPHLKYLPSLAHHELYALLFEILIERGKKIAIAAPRDFGKSTMITFSYLLYCICYVKEQYIMILSNTGSQACQILDNIRKELTGNPLIQSDFPELFGPNGKLTRSRENELITFNNIRIVALGSGQQVRGRRFGNVRPTLVIADDLENSENTFSSDSRQKNKNWYEKAVLNVGSEATNYIFIGNLYHPHSLLGEYINIEMNPGWVSKIYSAISVWPTSPLWAGTWRSIYYFRESYEGISGPLGAKKFYEAHKAEMDAGAVLLWPERYELYSLMAKHADNEFSFMSEYQNTPVDPSMCPFNVDEFHYWSDIYPTVEDLLRYLGDNAEFCGACDPSMADSVLKGDPSAIIILARDKRDKTMYVVVADIGHYKPEELVNYILAYYRRYKCTKFGFEANNFQGLFVKDLMNRAKEQGFEPNIVPIKNTTEKVKRILTLQPWLKSGAVKLSRNQGQALEEARYFPRGKHDDFLDALEMAVRMGEEFDNGFSCWVGGSTIDPWTGEVLTSEEQMKRATAMPAEGGLVPYGYYSWQRLRQRVFTLLSFS